MNRPYLLDQIVGTVGVLSTLALLSSRWHALSSQHITQQVLAGCLYLLISVLSFISPRMYSRRRTAIVVAAKSAILLLPTCRMQVRLNQPPSGRLVSDLFNAIVGLRLGGVVVAGLVLAPWPVWVVLQAGLLAAVANLEVDCGSELLSDPLMASRISKLHQAMQAISLPQLHGQAGGLMPRTPLGQCKAAISFVAPLVGLLLPALIMLPPPRLLEGEGGSRGASPGWGRFSSGVKQLLLVLRFQGGERWVPPWSVLAWWILLVLTWLGSVLLFRGA